MPNARAIAAWSANCSRVPTTLPCVCVWSCTSICHAPLLATTISTRRAMAHRGVDLHRVEAEGAVAGRHDDRRDPGQARLAAMPNGVPTPMQPSEPGSSQVDGDEADAREAQEIAAVGDDDGVRRRCAPAGRRAGGWDGCARRVRRRGRASPRAASQRARRAARAGPRAQSRSTAGARSPAAATIAVERRAAVGEDLDVAAAVVAQLGRDVGDAHEARVAEHRRRTVRKLEVEPAADGQHDVGLAHHGAAHRGDDATDGRRERGPRLSPVSRYGAPRRSSRRTSARPGAARAAAADDERPPRRPQQIHRRAHGAGVRRQRRAAASARRCSSRCSARGTSARSVSVGKSRYTGSRLAALAERARHGFVEFLQHQRRLAHRARVARDRAHEVGVDDVLQRAAVLLRPRRHAGEHQHRRARDVRVGDAGHRIGDAGAGGHQRDAEAAGQLAVAHAPCRRRRARRGRRRSRCPRRRARIQIGMMCPPQRPNTRSTPRAFRKRAMSAGGGIGGRDMAAPDRRRARAAASEHRRSRGRCPTASSASRRCRPSSRRRRPARS